MGSRRRIKYIDVKKKTEYAFEDDFDIHEFRSVVYDAISKKFIVVANKMDGVQGFYLFQFDVKDAKNVQFLHKQATQLEIGDVNAFILDQKSGAHDFLELIVAYKTIYINTYNVISIDLTNPENAKKLTVYRHESF